MKLVFVTNNLHKLKEAKAIIEEDMEIISLAEIGCAEDIAETATTIEGNAALKSFYVYNKYGINCFADDTGLEILALNGRPGVYSARYAGEGCSFTDNVKKVLEELQGIEDRRASFRCAICLVYKGNEYLFEGRVDGDITIAPSGTDGFGYDPVFRPEGMKETFAQMPAYLKNGLSHRGRAVHKMLQYLSMLQ